MLEWQVFIMAKHKHERPYDYSKVKPVYLFKKGDDTMRFLKIHGRWCLHQLTSNHETRLFTTEEGVTSMLGSMTKHGWTEMRP